MQFKTRVAAGALASAAILGLSQIPAGAPEPGFERTQMQEDRKESQANWDRETIYQPPTEWGWGDFKAAKEYADWCGGTVYIGDGDGPYVKDCDE
jgi:hypothetical protein